MERFELSYFFCVLEPQAAIFGTNSCLQLQHFITSMGRASSPIHVKPAKEMVEVRASFGAFGCILCSGVICCVICSELVLE